jgi:integrase
MAEHDPTDDGEIISLDDAERTPLEVYLSSLKESGHQNVIGTLNIVARWMGQPDASAVDWSRLRFEHVLKVRTRLQGLGRAPATIHGYVAYLRGVARAAWLLGQMSAEDYHRIRDVRATVGERLLSGRALEPEEVEALFEVCARDLSPFGDRDAAILTVLAGGGLRRAECAGLDLEDYDPGRGSLRFIGKRNKERLVYLAEGSGDAIAGWLRRRGYTPGPLFYAMTRVGRIEPRRLTDGAIYHMLKKRAREAKLTHFSPHDLRRTFISDLLDLGADMPAIQRLAGHSNVSTTARYDRRGERAARKAAGMLRMPYKGRRGLRVVAK